MDTQIMRRWALSVMVVLFLGMMHAAQADTMVIEKKSGGVVEGEILEETPSHLLVKTKFGNQKIDRTDIKSMRKGISARGEYAKRRKELKDTDGPGLIKLGAWCEKKKLWRPAYSCYGEAMQIAGAHYPDAVMHMGALAIRQKEYPVAVKLYSQLVEQMKLDEAWKALQKAEEMLRTDRRTFWKRAAEELDEKHYENAIAAYLEVLNRIVYEKPTLSGDISRAQAEEALLACRKTFQDALRTAWIYSPETPIARMSSRYRETYSKLEGAASMASQSSNAAAQMERIRQVVAMYGMLLPYAVRLDYEAGAVLRDDLPDLLVPLEDLPASFISSWERESQTARKQFLMAYSMELAAHVHGTFLSTDKGGARWSVRPVPDNIREATREVTLRELRVNPERSTGRWLALHGVLRGTDTSGKRTIQLFVDEEKSEDVTVVAYTPAAKEIHKFLLTATTERPLYLKSLIDHYPYDRMQMLLRSLPEDSELVLYGRLRQRHDLLPLYIYEVWDIDAVEDPGALQMANRLKRPLRCELRDTPVKDVLEFVTMVSQVKVKFDGGKTPDLNITLIAKRQPVILTLDRIARECGVQWTREDDHVLMKAKLGKDDQVRQNQVRRLSVGLKK